MKDYETALTQEQKKELGYTLKLTDNQIILLDLFLM